MLLKEIKKIGIKIPRLFFGFLLCSLGIQLMLKAKLGMAPWGIFHEGLSIQTGLSFGQISQITGLVIIILCIPLKVVPGVGTILNMYFIGFFIDMIDKLNLLFVPETVIGKLIMLFLGIWTLSIGIFFYLSCKLGAGPRDGLMLGLVKQLNLSVSIIKTIIEVIISIIGYLLGGTLGIGTIIIALSMGFTIQTAFRIGGYDAKNTEHHTLKDIYIQMTKPKEIV